MEYTQESLRELAERIYDLDAEVYTRLPGPCVQPGPGTLRDGDRPADDAA